MRESFEQFDMGDPETALNLSRFLAQEDNPRQVWEILQKLYEGMKIAGMVLAFLCPEEHYHNCDGSDCRTNGDHSPWAILRACAEEMEGTDERVNQVEGMSWDDAYQMFWQTIHMEALTKGLNDKTVEFPPDFSPDDIIGGDPLD